MFSHTLRPGGGKVRDMTRRRFDQIIQIGLTKKMLDGVLVWADNQPGEMDRPSAIRALIDIALAQSNATASVVPEQRTN